MHEAFQKRCTQNYGNLISDFNNHNYISIAIFFSNLGSFTAYVTTREFFEEKKQTGTILDTDKKEIFFPEDITKLETLEIIYLTVKSLYGGNIPEGHPFYSLCKIFVADWNYYYQSIDFQKYNKSIFNELVEGELQKISGEVVRILRDLEISEEDKKDINEIRKQKFVSIKSNINKVCIDFQSMISDFTQACLESEESESEVVDEDNNSELLEKYKKVGKLSFDETNYKDAILYFKIVLDQEPDNLNIQEYLGICFYYEERHDDAKKILDEVHRKDKERIGTLRYLVFMEFKAYMDKSEDLDTYNQIEAEKILKKAKKVYDIDKSFSYQNDNKEDDNKDYECIYDIKIILGELYAIVGNYDIPKKIYEEILQKDPNNLDMIFKLIQCFYNLKQYETMLIYCSVYLKLEIQNVDLWFLLRDYYAQIGEYEISKLAEIIGTLYEGEQVIDGGEHLKKLNSLDLTQDDDKVYEYFMSFITQKEALT